MNNQQLKEMLLKLDDTFPDFTVIMSGKASKKVDGLYHPETKEIIIHNLNFENDENRLIYITIHEYAHHLHHCEEEGTFRAGSHTNSYWNLFHTLLKKAEDMGIYTSIFEDDPKFRQLTKQIRGEYLQKNGALMKDFGKLLIEALDYCQRKQVLFEDYVDRYLGLNKSIARLIMKMYAYDIQPEIGYDNMKMVANIKEPERRQMAQEAFSSGASPQMVKQQIVESRVPQSETLNLLQSKKRRVEKSISELQEKLLILEERIEGMAIGMDVDVDSDD